MINFTDKTESWLISMFISRVVVHKFEPRSSQTKDSAKHAALRSKNKTAWLAQNQVMC
jgi:hypothetical protein